MLKYFSVLLLLVHLNTVNAEISVEEGFNYLDISDQLSIYSPAENEGVNVDVNRASVLFASDKLFIKNDKQSLPLGNSDKGYWIKGTLFSASQEKDLVLSLLYFHFSSVKLFIKQENNEHIVVKQFFRSAPPDEQISDVNVVFTLPVSAQPTQFLLYVKPIGVSYNVYNIHAVLRTLENYDREKTANIIIKSLTVGFIVSMFLYNMLLYLLVGYKPYLYYCCYIISLFILIYFGSGLVYLGPMPLSSQLVVAIYAMTPTFAALSLVLFARNILKLSHYMPRLDRLYKKIQYLLIVCFPITLLNWPAINAWLLNVQLMVLFSLGLVSYLLHRRHDVPGALVFSLSFVFLGLGASLHIWLEVLSFETLFDSDAFFIFYRWLEENMFNVSAMVEMTLLSAALAAFIKRAEKDKLAAQEEKYILVQDSLSMKEQYSAQLVTEVKARTKELKQKNVELKELQAVRDRFFGYITHEFRSPLTLILGPLSDIQRGRHGGISQSLSKAITLAEDHAKTLLGLVNHLLELARLRDSRLKLSIIELNVVSSLDAIIAKFTLPLADKNISLSVDSDWSDSKLVWFDQRYFDSIFTNLLSNACQRTPTKGHIRLSCSTDDDYVQVCVLNSGSYIPVEIQGKIFDQFYRQEPSVDSTMNSTGIGLAQVKEYLDLHGGGISVRSDKEKGTIFTVKIKRGREAHFFDDKKDKDLNFIDASLFVNSESVGDDNKNKKLTNELSIELNNNDDQDVLTVVVVDDNPELRTYVSQLLEENNYRVLTAKNGEQAYALCQSQLPDLMVSDVVMPDVSGLELVQLVRNNEDLKHLPIILLTSEVEKSDQIQGIENGADDYLTKPFVPGELLARISRIISQRKLVRDKYFQELFVAQYDNSAKSREDILSRCNTLIYEHLSETDFGVERLAESLHVSRSTLSRQLKEKHQLTAVQMILDARMKVALDLLKTDSLLIDIAYAVGFKSQSYFSRRFVEKFGMPPSQWRKNRYLSHGLALQKEICPQD